MFRFIMNEKYIYIYLTEINEIPHPALLAKWVFYIP